MTLLLGAINTIAELPQCWQELQLGCTGIKLHKTVICLLWKGNWHHVTLKAVISLFKSKETAKPFIAKIKALKDFWIEPLNWQNLSEIKKNFQCKRHLKGVCVSFWPKQAPWSHSKHCKAHWVDRRWRFRPDGLFMMQTLSRIKLAKFSLILQVRRK